MEKRDAFAEGFSNAFRQGSCRSAFSYLKRCLAGCIFDKTRKISGVFVAKHYGYLFNTAVRSGGEKSNACRKQHALFVMAKGRPVQLTHCILNGVSLDTELVRNHRE